MEMTKMNYFVMPINNKYHCAAFGNSLLQDIFVSVSFDYLNKELHDYSVYVVDFIWEDKRASSSTIQWQECCHASLMFFSLPTTTGQL
jgi:hypothetical protein